MTTLNEIERAIQQLPPDGLAAFRTWFQSFDAQAWDEQITQDVAAGKLDRFAEEALRDFREGRCTEL